MRYFYFFIVFLYNTTLLAQDWKAGYHQFFEQINTQDFEKALATGDATMQLLEKSGKTTDTAYANIAYYMGYIYFSSQQYEKALEYGIKDVEARKKIKDQQYYNSEYMLAAYYGHLEKYDQAIVLMKEVAAHAGQQYGNYDKNAVQMYYQLANLNQNAGYIYEAEALHEQNYAAVVAHYTPADSLYQATVNAIYTFYYTTGNFRKAEPFYTDALVQLEKQYGGKENADYLNALKGLVQFYMAADMLDKAVDTYETYVRILPKVLGTKESPDYKATLEDYIQLCLNAVKFDKAEKAYQEDLQLTEKMRGTKKDTAYITLLNTVGEFYINSGQYEKAENTYNAFVKLVQEYFGKNSADYATALNNLAVTYEKQGKNTEAEKLYFETLRIKEKVYKKESNYYALTLLNLGVLYDNMGRYADAEKVLEQALKSYEKISGGENENYANALNSIASVYMSNGKTKQALGYMQQSLDIYRKTQGENSAGYLMTLGNMANIHAEMGDYNTAEEELITAITLGEKVLGPQHSDLGVTIYKLAGLESTLGKYSEAEQLFQRAISIQQKAVGEKHGRYANATEGLASFYATTGQYEKAGKAYLKCEELFRKVYGERNPEYATLLNNMGYYYFETGDYKKAEVCLEKAIVIDRDNFGEEHPSNIPLLNSRANIKMAIGDPKTAEEDLLKAVKIAEQHYGPQHPDYAAALNNLATLYRSLGNYDLAKNCYERSLELRKKIYGEKHQEYAVSLNNLGALYLSLATDAKDQRSMQQNAQIAIDYFKQAAHIDSIALGADHADLAGHLNNLAEAYRLTNQAEEAEKNYLQSIAIEQKHFGEFYSGTAVSYHNLALLYAGMNQFPKAEEYAMKSIRVFEKNFGPGSHAAASVTASLAYIYEMQDKNPAALEQYTLAGKINSDILKHNFSFLSENEKEKFLASVDLYDDMFSTFAVKYGKDNPGVYAQVYENTLRNKGILFRSGTHMREVVFSSGDTTLVNIYERWNNLKKSLADVYALPAEKRNANPAEIEEKANTLEKELVSKTGTQNEQEADWKEIQKTLQPGQAAIEFIEFVYNDEQKKNIYCALVLKPGMEHPRMVVLFEKDSLEKALGKFGANNYEYVTGVYGKQDSPGKALYGLVWQPMQEWLSGVKEIYYAPAGLLNKVSFASVRAENGRYLSERYILHTVTSTARLLGKNNAGILPGKPLMAIFGGVKYNSEQTTAEVWKYLPGTLSEAEKISSLVAQNNVLTQTFTGSEATESNIKKLNGAQSPDILHVATHGFFYADPGEIKESVKEESVADVNFRGGSRGVRTLVENPNPLMRSGVVLAGANDVWNESETAKQEDGVLTAYEVSLMHLKNTELTVLSACETGLGDIKGSEGVYGLQRAFRMAGSKFVIMSLWQVPDKETEEFMVNFYAALLKSKSIRKAFTETQAQQRKKYDPYYWAAFVLLE